jgi:hypothetical protein
MLSANSKTRIPTRGAVVLAASTLAALLLAACGGYSGTSGTTGSTPAGSGGSSGTAPSGAAAHRYGAPVTRAAKPVSGKPASSQTKRAAKNQESSAPATSAAEGKPAAGNGETTMAQSEAGGIPQNNGGDQDADNNGGQATETEMSSQSRRVVTAIIVAAGLAGMALLGMSVAARSTASSRAASGGARPAGLTAIAPLSGLSPLPAPEHWRSATIGSGAATLFYPSGWHPIRGDSGRVTAALRDRAGLYAGYLNVTP